MAVIAISQQIGSRGIELGELAARELGYRFQTGEQLIAETAKRFNVSAEQMKWFDVHSPHFWERKTDTSRFAAYYRAVFLQEAAQDRIVVAGRGSSHFLPEGGCGIRVRTMAPVADRIKQVAKEEKLAAGGGRKARSRLRHGSEGAHSNSVRPGHRRPGDLRPRDQHLAPSAGVACQHAGGARDSYRQRGQSGAHEVHARRRDRGAGACGAGGASENSATRRCR